MLRPLGKIVFLVPLLAIASVAVYVAHLLTASWQISLLWSFPFLIAYSYLWPELWGLLSSGDGPIAKHIRVRSYLHHLLTHNAIKQLPDSLVRDDERIELASVYLDLHSYLFNTTPYQLSQLLHKPISGKAKFASVITGNPGSGKSVSLQVIALSCANSALLSGLPFGQRFFTHDTIARLHKALRQFEILYVFFDKSWLLPAPAYVPVLVNLQAQSPSLEADLKQVGRPGLDPEKTVTRMFSQCCPGLPEKQLWELFFAGRLALLFDGLDEMNPEVHSAFLDLLKWLWKKSGNEPNLLLLTCRKGTFRALISEQLPYYERIELEVLTADDRQALARKYIHVNWLRSEAKQGSVLAEVKRLRAIAPVDESNQRRPRPAVSDIIDDMAEELLGSKAMLPEIVIPHNYSYTPLPMAVLKETPSAWSPIEHPLGLKRFILVLLDQASVSVCWAWDKKTRPRVQIQMASLGGMGYSYIKLLEDYIFHLLARRDAFEKTNGYSKEDLMALYGEIGFATYEKSYAIGESFLNDFVKKNTKDARLSLQEQVQLFELPGLVTLVPSKDVSGTGNPVEYSFRDRETGHFLTARYMTHGGEVAERIDRFLEMPHPSLEDRALVLGMAFANLAKDAFKRFVMNTQHFVTILEPLIAANLGAREDAALSVADAESLLDRSIQEVAKPQHHEPALGRLWILIRHCLFHSVRLYSEPKVRSRITDCLIKIIGDQAAPRLSQAQAMLLLAELTLCDVPKKHTACKIAQQLLHGEDALLRSCGALALTFLLEDGLDNSELQAALRQEFPSGPYAIGDKDNPSFPKQREFHSDRFQVGRFPVLQFEYARAIGAHKANIAPGAAFLPLLGVSLDEAHAYAKSRGALLPRAAELQIAAGFDSLGKLYRQYPWGESADLTVLEDMRSAWTFKAILRQSGDSLIVGLQPSSAPPTGIFDLCGNIWQLTTDRPFDNRVGVEPDERLIFGPPGLMPDITQYRCADFATREATGKLNNVGIRLVWHT